MNRNALDTLIELATRSSEEAAQALGRALQAAREADEKLKLLQNYRAEYALRCEQAMQQGVSVAAWRNFQQFLAKLDQAIEGQEQVLALASGRVQSGQEHYLSTEKKRISFDTLAARADRQQEKRANRLDQKLMDEYAMRAALSRRSSN